MSHSVITDKFQSILDNNPEADYRNQKKLAITLVAVGVILSIGCIVAMAYTRQLGPIYPVCFSLVLGFSLITTFSPSFTRFDWTPYHDENFYRQVRQDFRKINDSNELRKLFAKYKFEHLSKYGYFKKQEFGLTIYEPCKDDLAQNTGDFNRKALERWNNQFA